MSLAETFEITRPSIVALGSKMAVTKQGQAPLFPTIYGTGFIVDNRGIVLTNRHVAEVLQNLPPHPRTGKPSAFALLYSNIEASEGVHGVRVFFIEVKGYNIPTTFTYEGDYYGEPMPDLAFLQLNVRDVPALNLATEPNTIRIGMPIATAGFALGEVALTVYQKVNQITPLLRHGVVSSVFPFPCPQPHGFTVDIMTQGGESGSPIFLAGSPVVVGLLHAGFDNTNITYALPSLMLSHALSSALSSGIMDLSDAPTFQSLVEQSGRNVAPSWEVIRDAAT